MNHEDILLSEISQLLKGKYRMMPLTRGIIGQIHRDRKQNGGSQGRGSGGEREWGIV